MKLHLLLPLLLTLKLAAMGFGSENSNAGNTDWPQFRGPGGNAVADGSGVALPFGPGQNLRWKAPLPVGHSSPCVWGDRIFLTGYEGLSLRMICLNAKSGKALWTRERKMRASTQYVHIASSPANPTPATDGTRVVFVFNDYGVVVTDLNGNLQWEKKLSPTQNEYSDGSSPMLYQDRIYLNRDGAADSCLLCLDAGTGSTKWKAVRPDAEFAFSTPYLLSRGDSRLVIVGGTGRVTAYNAWTGDLVWQVNGLPNFACPSPAASGELVFYGGWTTAHLGRVDRIKSVFDEEVKIPPEAMLDPGAFIRHFDKDNDGRLQINEFPSGRGRDSFRFGDANLDGHVDVDEWAIMYIEKQWEPGRNVLLAIDAGGRGDVTRSHVRWETTRGLPYVPSPLAHRGRLYLVASGGFLTCLHCETGQTMYQKRRLGVAGEYYASPVAVGEHIIVCANRGSVFVIQAGDHFSAIHRTDLGEAIYATPAVAGDTVLIRSKDHLWAFGR